MVMTANDLIELYGQVGLNVENCHIDRNLRHSLHERKYVVDVLKYKHRHFHTVYTFTHTQARKHTHMHVHTPSLILSGPMKLLMNIIKHSSV